MGQKHFIKGCVLMRLLPFSVILNCLV